MTNHVKCLNCTIYHSYKRLYKTCIHDLRIQYKNVCVYMHMYTISACIYTYILVQLFLLLLRAATK